VKENLKAIILVGGEGTRLRPLTYWLPKQMLPMCNMTMIERVVMHLSKFGITEVVLSLGYKPEPFLKAFPTNELFGVKLSYVVEPQLMDTAGAIRYAFERSEITKAFIAINGDVFSDINVGNFVSFHKKTGSLATICLTKVEDPSRYGVAVLNSENKILDFVEKPPKEKAPSRFINAGYYVLEPQVIDLIKPGMRVSIEKEIFPNLASLNKLSGFIWQSYWIDTGTPQSYIKAALDLLNSSTDPIIPDAQLIEKNIYFGKSVKCLAELKGNVLIGSNSDVGRGILSNTILGNSVKIYNDFNIENSYIFDNVVIHDKVEIKNSIIGAGAIIEHSCVLNDCVVGFDVKVESGGIYQGEKIPQ
jgi:mannose-1-phosphate guanylyltransferase